MSEVFYPFANQPSQSNQNVFPYDILVNETYPGVIFDPTEPSGVYSVIREVTGCLWFVNNADWDPNTLQWTQESPTNANLPAYALELCANGLFTRFYGTATLVPGSPITWQAVFNLSATGYINSTPLTVTSSGLGQNQLSVTWNAGIATQVEARRVVVTDTSSASNSVLDNLVVNGTSKWLIDKTGTLINGSIPFARITGYSPPSFNNVTLTGNTTMTGNLHVQGTETVDGSITGNSTLYVAANANLHGGVTVTGGETVDTLTVTGNESVAGTGTIGTLHVTGNSQLDGSLDVNGNVHDHSSLTVDGTTNLNNVTISGTVTTTGSGSVVTLESTDTTVNITNPSANTYDFSVPRLDSTTTLLAPSSGPGSQTIFISHTYDIAAFPLFGARVLVSAKFDTTTTLTLTGPSEASSGGWQFPGYNFGNGPTGTMSVTCPAGFTSFIELTGIFGSSGSLSLTIANSAPPHSYNGTDYPINVIAWYR